LNSAHASWEALSSLADLIVPKSTTRQDFLNECRSGTLDNVLVIFDRAPASFATGKFDKDLVDALPSTVKFICHMGAGYDSIDIPSCSRRGIRVSNVPHQVDAATADTAIFLILAALRGFNNGIMAIRNRTWRGAVPPPPLGRDPEGKVLGILGMGGVGRALKRRAEVFGLRTIYHNRRPLGEGEAEGAEFVGFEELLARSDVLSLNLPLNVSLTSLPRIGSFLSPLRQWNKL
jgi:glyoxylate reductase